MQVHRSIVLDSSYDLATIRSRDLLEVVTGRDLDGYFEHVWTVHPLVGASPEHRSDGGPPTVSPISEKHTFIEGHVRWPSWNRLSHTLGFIKAQASLLHMLNKIAREVDVVQAGDPYYTGLIATFLARRHNAVLCVRVPANHDAIYEATGELVYPRIFRRRWVEKRIARAVFRRARLVFPANDDNAAFAVANGAAQEDCVVVPGYGNVINSVHLTEPEGRSSDALPDGLFSGPVLVMVSRLEPVKHPEDAVDVLEQVREAGIDATLLVIGEGSMRSSLEISIKQRGLSSAVTLAGSRPQGWIATALARASVILSPLTGRALVEALLGGRPVVAYDVEWQSDVVHDGETGILVPYRDVTAMAEAALRILRTPDLAARLGKAGRTLTLGLVERDRVIKLQRDAYSRVLSKMDAR